MKTILRLLSATVVVAMLLTPAASVASDAAQRSAEAEVRKHEVSLRGNFLATVLVQCQLQQGGYYTSAIDGRYGPQTRKALIARHRDLYHGINRVSDRAIAACKASAVKTIESMR